MNSNNNIGILDLEVYFPKQFVDQSELEIFDGVSQGKYTIGLGQQKMSFPANSEDIISISLTVTQNLLDRQSLDKIKSIGYLAVGTETLLDKSKSLKTSLMQLFPFNHDIEGITHLNACYGGTDALFSACSWLESSSCDGRLALVICADIAFYQKGPARPTGGCGAVAILLGPNAPVIIDNLRNSFFENTYDFCKPNPFVEYPTIDGSQTVQCYLTALKNCYLGLKEKYQNKRNLDININNIDYFCFHTPFVKLVWKSFLKLLKIDILNQQFKPNEAINLQQLESQNFLEKHIQELLGKIAQPLWEQKVAQTLLLSQNCGNMYTASLYASLASLISNAQKFQNKTILMFSYGSGLASSMFLLRCQNDLSQWRNSLNLKERLEQRLKIAPKLFDKIMIERELNYGKLIEKPQLEFDKLFDKSFYLEKIEKNWKRTYSRLMGNHNPSDSQNKEQSQLRMCQLSGQFSEKMVELQQENKQFPASGFYKQPLEKKLRLIQNYSVGLNTDAFESGGLALRRADLMVENCIGKLSLPLGLGLNFVINGKERVIPMATEEPSVIAAASGAAKFIKENSIANGFSATSTDQIMTGQLLVMNCINNQEAQDRIISKKNLIINEANKFCQSLVRRGGGVIDCNARILSRNSDQILVVDLDVNVCESMGANIVNTICESLAPIVQEITQGRVCTKILTNLCIKRKATAEFCIPVNKLATKTLTGEEVAKRILETYKFAEMDVFRATTNNKGIMNGIDAAAIALGQDWRALEAAAHAFAFYKNKNQQYSSLTEYSIKFINGELYFIGKLELPIAVGSKGGVLGSNPIYLNNLQLLGNPTNKQISEILVSVGLAQNFAAIKALSLEGIQKGHMNLHAKNIALQAEVPVYLVEKACEFMKSIKSIKVDTAKQFLNLQKNSKHQTSLSDSYLVNQNLISQFYVNYTKL